MTATAEHSPLVPELVLAGTDLLAWQDYSRSLRAARKSPRTIQGYGEALCVLGRWLAAERPGVTVLAASRADVEEFMIWLGDTYSVGTAINRYRSLRAAYRWFEDEDLIAKSPMRRIEEPKGDQKEPQVLSDADLTALLAACKSAAGPAGRLAALRDRAVIGIWCEAGSPRLAEMAGITLADIDLSRDQILVHGKGRKDRMIPLSPQTARDLSRYLRERAGHKFSGQTDAAWLGDRAGFGQRGLSQMLADRAAQARIGHVHPHQMRHTAFHRARLAGLSIDDCMILFGWSPKSIAMAMVYGRSAAGHRAREAARGAGLREGL